MGLRHKIHAARLLPLLAFTILAFQNCSRFDVTTEISGASVETPSIEKRSLIVSFGDSLTRGANPKNSLNTGIKGYVPQLENKISDDDFLNCGIGGQTTADAKSRFSEILLGNYNNCSLDVADSASTAAFYDFSDFQGKRPDTILFWMGTNDVLKNDPSQSESIENLRWYLSQAKAQQIKVIMSTIPPYGNTAFAPMTTIINGITFDRVKAFNSLIEQAATEFPGTIVIDTYGALNQNFQAYTWDQIHLSATAYQLVTALWEKALKSNSGKTLFVNDGQNACLTAAGIFIPSGVSVCSCLSNNLGSLSRCNNGSFEPLFNLNQSCNISNEDHQYVNHHCLN